MAGVQGSVPSLLRRFRLGSGPLKRGSDRLQVALRLLLLAVLLMGIPVALAVGTAAHSQIAAEATVQAASRFRVTARLTADALISADGNSASAPAAWSGPSGTRGVGVLSVAATARKGSTVPVWVDRSGHSTREPLTPSDVTAGAVGYSLGTLAGIWFTAAGGYLLVRRMIDRHRLRAWADEWAAVGPVWTRTVS
ncbi:MAG: Rv1733c family protein [Blastococcus sp.]